MIDPEVVKWAEDLAETARMNLERDGEIHPVAFVWKADKTCDAMLLTLVMGTDEDKEKTFKMLRRYAIETKALAVFTIIESWMRMFDIDEKPPHDGKVAGYPDKKECVMFNLATPQGNKVSCMEITTKLPDETKTFGPFS